MAKKKTPTHAYRTGDADRLHLGLGSPGKVVCDCDKKFDTDAEWRAHYERETTAAERKKLESSPKPK